MSAGELLGLPDFLGRPLAIVLIDLLLAGDNALVIALVCAALPARRLRLVLLLGTLGAVVLRIIVTAAAGAVLTLPGPRLAGGVLLAVVALNLARRPATPPPLPASSGDESVLGVALVVALVDVLMSLDNVVGIAAVAGDSILLLAIGLCLSVAILMFASTAVAGLLRRVPDLARLGVALLGWIAGDLALSDGLIVDWVREQAPALSLVVPALAAVFAFTQAQLPAAAVPVPALSPRPPVPARRAAAPPRRRAVPPPRPDSEPISVESPAAPAGAGQRELLVLLALFGVVGLVLAVAVVLGSGAIQ